jgi:hypothetical protein
VAEEVGGSTFTTIAVDESVADVFAALARKELATRYCVVGAQGSSNEWRASGFYAAEPNVSRVVLETLFFLQKGICVIRVFREQPFELFSAWKVVGDPSRLHSAIAEAARVFEARMPVGAVAADPVDPEEAAFWESVAPGTMNIVLAPIPPPVQLSDVAEYRVA